MYATRSGQSQVLTAVLLGGILIAGISAAYIWGLPILRKNQDVNNAQQSLATLEDVADGISTVANEGGSRSIRVSLGSGTLNIDTDNETVRFRALTRGAYVSTTRWTVLNENDMQGVNRTTGLPDDGYGARGVDSAALLIGKAERGSDAFTTFYRIVLRDLYEAESGETYTIDLVRDGNLQASGGDHTVVFRRDGEETEAGAGVDGGTLRRVRVLISLQ